MEEYSNKKDLELNKAFKKIDHSSHYGEHKLMLKSQNYSKENNKNFDWDWIFDKEWLRIKK